MAGGDYLQSERQVLHAEKILVPSDKDGGFRRKTTLDQYVVFRVPANLKPPMNSYYPRC